jgi:hypothetical protein
MKLIKFLLIGLCDLELAVRLNMPQMLERYPGTGWVARQAHQVLQDEINACKSKFYN